MPTYTLDQTAKTWVAAIGVLATALLGIFAGDTTAGWILTIVVAVGTVVAVYVVPNAPTEDDAPMSVFDPPPPEEDEAEEAPVD
ncbi:MAG TPA: hypothetical protein VKB55_00810 [Nocardioidaceae bacterium]|jgi:hypothetical protein|nr:hypothetical protein [Nocardioidaceae bacterium]